MNIIYYFITILSISLVSIVGLFLFEVYPARFLNKNVSIYKCRQKHLNGFSKSLTIVTGMMISSLTVISTSIQGFDLNLRGFSFGVITFIIILIIVLYIDNHGLLKDEEEK